MMAALPPSKHPECYYTWIHVSINDSRCMYCGRRMDTSSTYTGSTKATARTPKKRSRKKERGIPNPYNQHAKNHDPHAARFA